jgi:hypothetical protein
MMFTTHRPAVRHVCADRKGSLAGEIGFDPAPKEQPPRKLSGKRTAKGMKFWKAEPSFAALTEGVIPG